MMIASLSVMNLQRTVSTIPHTHTSSGLCCYAVLLWCFFNELHSIDSNMTLQCQVHRRNHFNRCLRGCEWCCCSATPRTHALVTKTAFFAARVSAPRARHSFRSRPRLFRAASHVHAATASNNDAATTPLPSTRRGGACSGCFSDSVVRRASGAADAGGCGCRCWCCRVLWRRRAAAPDVAEDGAPPGVRTCSRTHARALDQAQRLQTLSTQQQTREHHGDHL